ncbi:MAG: MtnX-like HAD-IB family phosphatase [Chloroflexi bacterium]|nr:MtnX-like HAD-IB family phosphatase [Chloroflexota bacterium]
MFDFDGTVSPADMGHVIFDALATPEWRVIDDRWIRREIPTSVRARAQFDLVDPDLRAMHRLIDRQAVDPAFPALARGLQSDGAEVQIASDGFGFYISRMLAAAGLADLPVDSNRLEVRRGAIVLEFPYEQDGCGHCGMCKALPVRRAKARGRRAVYVGDGYSDRCAVTEADVVFAKDSLAAHCRAEGIPYHAFASLADVQAWVSHRTQVGESRR